MNDTLANGTKSSGLDYLQITFNSIKLTLGLPINSYVLWLILSGAGGTIASEFFYLNLIVPLIITSLASVFYVAWQFTYNSIFFRVYAITCKCFFWLPAPWFQCCICVERYIAVVHPVVFLRYKALRYRVACCCAVWLAGLAFSVLDIVFDPVYLDYVLVGFWAVCIAVVCFCCLSVLRALKQPGPGEGQRDSGEGNGLKRRAFRTILISLVVMSLTIMSFVPFVVFDLLNVEAPVFGQICSVIVMMSVFVHPLLYLHKAGKLPCFK